MYHFYKNDAVIFQDPPIETGRSGNGGCADHKWLKNKKVLSVKFQLKRTFANLYFLIIQAYRPKNAAPRYQYLRRNEYDPGRCHQPKNAAYPQCGFLPLYLPKPEIIPVLFHLTHQ